MRTIRGTVWGSSVQVRYSESRKHNREKATGGEQSESMTLLVLVECGLRALLHFKVLLGNDTFLIMAQNNNVIIVNVVLANVDVSVSIDMTGLV